MEKFEIELDDEYLNAIGRITVNFATLDQVISFFIWNLIEFDEIFSKLLTDVMSPSESRPWVEFMMIPRQGLEKMAGKNLGQIITAELSFGQKIDLLSSLYREKQINPTEVAKLDEVLARVADAEQKRNTVVHSVWSAYAVNESTARIKTTAKRKSKGLKIKIERISVEDLNNIADYIAKAAFDVQTLIIRFYHPNFRD